MTETVLLTEDPQAVERLNSLACLFEWMRSMPGAERKRFMGKLLECSDEIQDVVVSLLQIVKNPNSLESERKRALLTISDALYLNPDETDGEYGMDLARSEAYAAARSKPLAREVEKMNCQEATFAQRLRELMDAKQVSQRELADRIGCSQPAISQMLNRECRPQKKTILKLAEALNVQPRDLWPDIEVVEMLDAVASLQSDDYVMSAAEAKAFADTAKKNKPKLPVHSLPPRPQAGKPG